MNKPVKDKLIIGRKDRADFPELHLSDIVVKTDSGAYSCSIHCESVTEREIDGKPVLEVIFLDHENPEYTGEKFSFGEFRKKKVRSSTGYQQERYFIKLKIVLFGREFMTDFSLTQRNELRHPVLLGRKLLNRHFLINTAQKNLSYRAKTNMQ